ncbi:PPE domain-containing protein [Actinokineospora pegani]|uniref:PPE domain-containing protein n=1 Tax=Actinokineospora pegani TaxID=2654637 RepID=UPI0012EA9D5E|nr:PPE domain-containing protein [Actinokineospora pegani]
MTEQAEITDEVKRWRGFTHKELYQMLHEGPGAQASADPSRRWAALNAALTEIGQDLAARLGATSEQWTGPAAGVAYDRLAPLAAWATESATEAQGMRVVVENQADHIAKARAEMPAPEDAPSQQPDPLVPPAATVAAVQNDAEPIEAAVSAGEQKAFEVMAAYELNTTTNLSTVVGFTASPVVMQVETGRGRRGEGVQGSTHANSFTGHIQVGGQHDHQPHRPQHNGGWHGGGWHGGQGGVGVVGGGHSTGSSGASHTPQHTPVASRPLSPGAMAGTTPTDTTFGTPSGSTRQHPSQSRRERDGIRAGSGNQPLTSSGGADGAGRKPILGTFAGAGAFGTEGFGPAPATANGAQAGMGAAGAPMGGGMGAGGGADHKLAPRRFGPEAIGGSQWFGDGGDSVANNGGPGSASGGRQVGGRRRDLAQTEQPFSESVDIDGEDHRLPPGVIGG